MLFLMSIANFTKASFSAPCSAKKLYKNHTGTDPQVQVQLHYWNITPLQLNLLLLKLYLSKSKQYSSQTLLRVIVNFQPWMFNGLSVAATHPNLRLLHSLGLLFWFFCQGFHWPVCDWTTLLATLMQVKGLEINHNFTQYKMMFNSNLTK